jgi:hypothetical protein
MTHPDKNRKADTPHIESVPATEPAEVPRSGSGAGTALSAMLKKRKMRVTRDTDTDPQTPAPEGKTE